jgi:hypothetical protein
MNQTAVEWLAEKYDYAYWMVKRDEISPALVEEWKKHYLEQAKEMEAKQRQEDTNHGYSQGYDDGAQGKEPMQPEIFTLKEQSYQDKMRDKITKAKSRLK